MWIWPLEFLYYDVCKLRYCFSSLTAAILDFRLPVRYGDINISIFDFLDPENIGIAVGISFLSLLEAEIIVVWYKLPQGKPEITFEPSNPFFTIFLPEDAKMNAL